MFTVDMQAPPDQNRATGAQLSNPATNDKKRSALAMKSSLSKESITSNTPFLKKSKLSEPKSNRHKRTFDYVQQLGTIVNSRTRAEILNYLMSTSTDLADWQGKTKVQIAAGIRVVQVARQEGASHAPAASFNGLPSRTTPAVSVQNQTSIVGQDTSGLGAVERADGDTYVMLRDPMSSRVKANAWLTRQMVIRPIMSQISPPTERKAALKIQREYKSLKDAVLELSIALHFVKITMLHRVYDEKDLRTAKWQDGNIILSIQMQRLVYQVLRNKGPESWQELEQQLARQLRIRLKKDHPQVVAKLKQLIVRDLMLAELGQVGSKVGDTKYSVLLERLRIQHLTGAPAKNLQEAEPHEEQDQKQDQD